MNGLHLPGSTDDLNALYQRLGAEGTANQTASSPSSSSSSSSSSFATSVDTTATTAIDLSSGPGCCGRLRQRCNTIGQGIINVKDGVVYVATFRWCADIYNSTIFTPIRLICDYAIVMPCKAGWWVTKGVWWVAATPTKFVACSIYEYTGGWFISLDTLGRWGDKALTGAKATAQLTAAVGGTIGTIGLGYTFWSTIKPVWSWTVTPAWNWVAQPALGALWSAGTSLGMWGFSGAASGINNLAKDQFESMLPESIQMQTQGGNTVLGAIGDIIVDKVAEGASALKDEAVHATKSFATHLFQEFHSGMRMADRWVESQFYAASKFLNDLTFKDAMGWADWGARKIIDVGGAVWDNTSWEVLALVGAVAGYKMFRAFGPKIINHTIDYWFKSAKDRIGRIDFEQDYNIPVITPIVRGLKKVKNAVFPPIPKPKPLFKGTLQRRIENYIEMQQNAAANGGDLQHLALEGLPGTGKTLTANYIADRLGWNIVKVSGPKLCALINKKGDHIQEWNKLIKKARESYGQTMIFIDEADAFLADRDGAQKLSEGKLELLNQFLTDTGTSSDKVCFVVATNRYHALDQAVRSRLEQKIRVPLPDLDTRRNIIAQEVFRKFKSTDAELNQETGCLSWKGIDRIARVTRQLSGRSLEQMVKHLHGLRACQANGKLSQTLVEKQVRKFVKKARQDMGSERSWRVVEVADDMWHYWLPEVKRYGRVCKVLADAVVSIAKSNAIAFIKNPQGYTVDRVKACWKYVSEKAKALAECVQGKAKALKEHVVKAKDDLQKLVGAKPKTRWEKILDWFHQRREAEKAEEAKRKPPQVDGWANGAHAPAEFQFGG